MPLSTSNSNDRLPNAHWRKTWFFSLIIVVMSLFVWEEICKTSGFTADSVRDTDVLWARTREKASLLKDKAVILLGASRMQLGLNLKVLRQYTQTHPVQLAIDGNGFFPVLENLANDPEITGTIIISVDVQHLSRQTKSDRANEWVQYYNERKSNRMPLYYRGLEEKLSIWVNQLFAFRVADAKPHQVLYSIITNTGNFHNIIYTLPDRSRQADYSQYVNNEAKKRVQNIKRQPVVGTDPDFLTRIDELEALIKRIQDRGGKVVLVRFPSDGNAWKGENLAYPREFYWDKITANVSCRTIHFKDYPALSKYTLPDGSHLDYRDAIPFTQSLAEIIFNKPGI